MIDVTFRINDIDYSSLLSTYNVDKEVEYQQVVTTLDGTEHGIARYRPTIKFSLIPLTDAQCKQLYDSLAKGNIEVFYTNPHTNETSVLKMRVTSNIGAVFGIKSITGDRYYKCGEITLRSRMSMR